MRFIAGAFLLLALSCSNKASFEGGAAAPSSQEPPAPPVSGGGTAECQSSNNDAVVLDPAKYEYAFPGLLSCLKSGKPYDVVRRRCPEEVAPAVNLDWDKSIAMARAITGNAAALENAKSRGAKLLGGGTTADGHNAVFLWLFVTERSTNGCVTEAKDGFFTYCAFNKSALPNMRDPSQAGAWQDCLDPSKNH